MNALQRIYAKLPPQGEARELLMRSINSGCAVDIQNVYEHGMSFPEDFELIPHAVRMPWDEAVFFYSSRKTEFEVVVTIGRESCHLSPNDSGPVPAGEAFMMSGGFVMLWHPNTGAAHAVAQFVLKYDIRGDNVQVVLPAAMALGIPDAVAGVLAALNGESVGEARRRLTSVFKMPQLVRFIHGAVGTAVYAVMFVNCKNIVQDSIAPLEVHGNRAERRAAGPRFAYRVLRIDPGKTPGMKRAADPGNHPGVALHICRGHFARYTPEKPLFGKYSGAFWVPQHVKGSEDRGEVVKDYKVEL